MPKYYAFDGEQLTPLGEHLNFDLAEAAAEKLPDIIWIFTRLGLQLMKKQIEKALKEKPHGKGSK